MRTSSARVIVPVAWAYASGIIGLILLVFGFTIPSSIAKAKAKEGSYDTVVESKEDIEIGTETSARL